MSISQLKFPLFSIAVFLLFLGCSPELEQDLDFKAANRMGLGASANDLLSDRTYTSLRIEVAYVPGYEPSAAALENLKGFLHKFINKPEGISIVKTPMEPSGKSPFSIEEIRNIEDQYRSVYNNGEELAVFILFADGRSEAEEGTDVILGTAYRNTSMVLFEETIRKLSDRSSFVLKENITETTLQHEFGHLFGLVANGTPDQSGHMDSESKSHCNVSGCLMTAKLEFGKGMLEHIKAQQTTGLKQNASTFDEKCHQDLIANGGKQ